jgi:hypothetical protein
MKRMSMMFGSLLLLAGCASDPIVHTDHDPAADFSRYQTYAWRQQPAISNLLVKQRLIDAIDAELVKNGWTEVSEEQADVALVGNVATHEEQTIETFYGGPNWNGWGWRQDLDVGVGHNTSQIHSYTVGTLVLDIFDSKTLRAVWRGTAEGTVPDSPAKVNVAVQKAVDKMFLEFPPQLPLR